MLLGFSMQMDLLFLVSIAHHAQLPLVWQGKAANNRDNDNCVACHEDCFLAIRQSWGR
jgi:hypothetical protein